jgi:hypothetical protein
VVGKCERERGREGADGCGCGLRAFSTEGACVHAVLSALRFVRARATRLEDCIFDRHCHRPLLGSQLPRHLDILARLPCLLC